MKNRIKRSIATLTAAAVMLVGGATAASATYTINMDHLTLNQALVQCGNVEYRSGHQTTLHAFVDSIGRSHKHCVVHD